MCLIFTIAAINVLESSHFLETDQLCGTPGHDPCEVNIYYGADISNLFNQVQQPSITPPNSNDILSYPELAISAFGLLVRSLVTMILIFLYATIFLPYFLHQIGFPVETPIGFALTLGVWITYAVGYSQYKARSTLQGTE